MASDMNRRAERISIRVKILDVERTEQGVFVRTDGWTFSYLRVSPAAEKSLHEALLHGPSVDVKVDAVWRSGKDAKHPILHECEAIGFTPAPPVFGDNYS